MNVRKAPMAHLGHHKLSQCILESRDHIGQRLVSKVFGRGPCLESVSFDLDCAEREIAFNPFVLQAKCSVAAAASPAIAEGSAIHNLLDGLLMSSRRARSGVTAVPKSVIKVRTPWHQAKIRTWPL